jgi:hypothetical protein
MPRFTPNIEQLLRAAQVPWSEATAVQALNTIGVVGAIATDKSWVESIANALLAISMDEASGMELASAAIEAIIDLYAEAPATDDLRPVHSRILEAFRQLYPQFKRRVMHVRRRVDPDIWEKLDEVRINLARFISYKKSQF